jgi:hypothetical protein
MLLKAICIFNAIPIKISMTFFMDLGKSIISSYESTRDYKQPKQSREKQSNSEDIKIPDFSLYYRAIVMETAWYCRKNRNGYQWNRIRDPDTNSHSHSHLIFDKGPQNIHWGKDSLFKQQSWKTGFLPVED